MTNFSDSSGSLAENTKPSWLWLQQRVEARDSEPFSDWLDYQLAVLEQQFADLVTNKSRSRSVRDEIGEDQSRS